MIYFLYGKDTYRSNKKLLEIVSAFRTKNSDLGVFDLDEEGFSGVQVEELARTNLLFGKKNLVVLKNTLKNQEAKSFIDEKIELLFSSEHVFIFIEEEVDKNFIEEKKNFLEGKIQKFDPLSEKEVSSWARKEAKERGFSLDGFFERSLLEKHGSNLWGIKNEREKAALYAFEPEKKKEEINVFNLTDSVGKRDKKTAWTLYQKALLSGTTAEEIFWTLSWQIKTIWLVKRLYEEYQMNPAQISKEAGVKPFVVSNCIKFSQNFEKEKLKDLHEKLVNIYHTERLGKTEYETALESFLLVL